MSYVNYSIHWPDPEILERVKSVAKDQGVSPGAFIRQAAEKAVEKCEKKREKKSRENRAA